MVAAKESVPHGEWLKLVGQLSFGERTAQMLLKVGGDQKLLNTKHVSHLPASWGTLHELTKLDEEIFEASVEAGFIRPDMARKDVVLAQFNRS